MDDPRIPALLARAENAGANGRQSSIAATASRVRKLLRELEAAEKVAERTVKDFDRYETQVTVLSANVRQLEHRHAEMAQDVIEARAQAARQNSASAQATLLNIARKRELLLKEFEPRYLSQKEALANAHAGVRDRKQALAFARRDVARLESEIASLLDEAMPRRARVIPSAPLLEPAGEPLSPESATDEDYDGEGDEDDTEATSPRGGRVRRRVRRVRRRVVRVRR